MITLKYRRPQVSLQRRIVPEFDFHSFQQSIFADCARTDAHFSNVSENRIVKLRRHDDAACAKNFD